MKDYERQMLRPPQEVRAMFEIRGEINCHTDPLLRNNKKVYAQLIKRMLKIGIGSLTLECFCEIGIFFVAKKSGKIRLIRAGC